MIATRTRDDKLARRLATIPGIGDAFAKGCDLAVWLGLTPRRHLTGGGTKLLSNSIPGDASRSRSRRHR